MTLEQKDIDAINNYFSMNKYEEILILGNGFNIDLGLMVDYANYMEHLMETMVENSIFFESPMIQHLVKEYKLCKGNGGRFSIECSLEEYAVNICMASNPPKIDYSIIDKRAFDKLERDFQEFVFKSTRSQKVNKESSAYSILRNFQHQKEQDQAGVYYIYSFNYPVLSAILEAEVKDDEINGELIIDFIHGRDDGNKLGGGIIFGIDPEKLGQIPERYHFLLKEKHFNYLHRKKEEFKASLGRANTIKLFGHSLSPADRPYFEEFFNLSLPRQQNNNPNRVLVIYSLESSKEEVLRNIYSICSNHRFFYWYKVFFLSTDSGMLYLLASDTQQLSWVQI